MSFDFNPTNLIQKFCEHEKFGRGIITDANDYCITVLFMQTKRYFTFNLDYLNSKTLILKDNINDTIIGKRCTHKSHGKGIIIDKQENIITILFDNIAWPKDFCYSLARGLITIDNAKGNCDTQQNNTFKCLNEFNYNGLNELAKELKLDKWDIISDSIQHRKDDISYTKRFKALKKRTDNCDIYFGEEEIITWLDSLKILQKAFNKLEDENLRDNITILQEYYIPLQKRRPDYLLVYDKKILILEFSFKKLGDSFQHHEKLQQAIEYKELLSTILPKEIDIGTHTFLVNAEKDIERNEISSNEEDINTLAKIIEKFFQKYKNTALNALKNI